MSNEGKELIHGLFEQSWPECGGELSLVRNEPCAEMLLERLGATYFDSTTFTEEELRYWVKGRTGYCLAETSVCEGHQSPWEVLQRIHLERPALALILGSRGSGKSFLSALDTHLLSIGKRNHATRILGGSLAQSRQVYRALEKISRGSKAISVPWRSRIVSLLKQEASYESGSEVAILAASSTSVRGPHVPSLKLDEVDEIDPELREAAMGMCMNCEGHSASVLMTSTWHRMNGPMAGLVEQARSGAFPLYSFCAFEVLERCGEDRSGLGLEHCSECPLSRYCLEVPEGMAPKAKRSSGHYSIDALIQKLRSTSVRTFEADYLCRGPRADGLWFAQFHPDRHVAIEAEFDPSLPVHVSIDSGVFTGAVLFQVRAGISGEPGDEEVSVFADYLAEGVPAESNARAILEVSLSRCQGRMDVISTDPAGGARNPVGPTVIAEYERAGLKPIRRWPVGSVADGLALVDSLIHPADARIRFRVHPRCRSLIDGLMSYRRARRSGQWQDYPEDPQHPHEDLVDALRGGLRVCFPEGRTSGPKYSRLPVRRVI